MNIEGLLPAEIAYVGSFIEDPDFPREVNFYNRRSLVMHPEDMHSPETRNILEAIEVLAAQDFPATLDNLKNTLLTLGLAPVKDIDTEIKTWTSLDDILRYFAMRGGKTLKEFKMRERHMQEQWRWDRLTPDNISKEMDRLAKQGKNPFDLAIGLRNYAERLVSANEIISKKVSWEDQRHLFGDIQKQHRALVGAPRFTLPSSWQLTGLIPVLHPGRMLVLSGGTGDGKSSMAMEFAEWACICGKNVLVIHMEDSVEDILQRQTVRWIGGTLEELERGDPMDKMGEMLALREKWAANRGGSIDYQYLSGNTANLICDQVTEAARNLEIIGKHLDVVIMDYFQKVDFDSPIRSGQTHVNVANQGADAFKRLAEHLHLFMFIVSQETVEMNGEKHTAWTKALEQKCQIYISLTRHMIKATADEEYVQLGVNGQSVRIPISRIGDRSCWMQARVKKANQSRQGIVWLYYEGPRFRAFEPNFMKQVDAGQRGLFDVPILMPADETFYKRQATYLDAYHMGYYQLENPDQKKRAKPED